MRCTYCWWFSYISPHFSLGDTLLTIESGLWLCTPCRIHDECVITSEQSSRYHFSFTSWFLRSIVDVCLSGWADISQAIEDMLWKQLLIYRRGWSERSHWQWSIQRSYRWYRRQYMATASHLRTIVDQMTWSKWQTSGLVGLGQIMSAPDQIAGVLNLKSSSRSLEPRENALTVKGIAIIMGNH